jgi:hypothetical protein
VERIATDDVARSHFFGHLGDHVRRERRGVDLADAGDAGVGRQLHEDEIPTTESWWRIADHEGLDVDDLHVRTRSRCAARLRA